MTLQEIQADRAELARRWYAEGYWGAATIPEILAAGAMIHPRTTRNAFSAEHEGRTTTLPESLALSRALAAHWQRIGILPGDVIAVQMPNWWEAMVISQSIILAGAVLLPIIPILGPAELSFILRQSRARAFVMPDHAAGIDYLARLEALEGIDALEHVIVIGDRAPAGATSWRDFTAADAADLAPPPIHPDDDCLLLFTSGTTSAPKGVRHTHNTLIHEVRTFRFYRPVDPTNQVIFSAGPFGHIASALDVLRPFVTGYGSVSHDKWEAAACIDLITRYRPSASGGVPFYLLSLLEMADAGQGDLSSLRYFAMGATSINPSHVEELARRGITGIRSYGSTEHPTISCGRAFDPLDRRANTDGLALPGIDVRVVDDDDRDVEPGFRGELVTRGPDLFVGYTDPERELESFLPGGWFRTGDIVTRDEQGYITIVDRKKDIIIRGGENISSKEVEDVLVTMPAVREAAVVAMSDRRYGEKVCAFVTLRAPVTVTIEEVRAHFVALGLAKQKIPERIEIVDDLPRTAQGKVRKADLR
ncbi:MAG: AMP-binding protein, partial [Sphingomonadaceae bacterium]|nr:AMP-binding protein [Sphingomonadaceae bacterium]